MTQPGAWAEFHSLYPFQTALIVTAHYRSWRRKMVTQAYHTGVNAQADLKRMPSLEKLLSQLDREEENSDRETVKDFREFFRARREARNERRRARAG